MQPTALITGASRGLGRALARRLASDGWDLIIDARNPIALEEVRHELERFSKIIAISGDVKDTAHLKELADASQTQGGLHAVINNAGILGPSPQPPLLDYPLETLKQVFLTNVIAPLELIQKVQEHLHPGARLINITSDAGINAYPGWGGYGSSKAALEHLSSTLAAENPLLHIYWVDPGDMRTQMHQEAFPDEDMSDRPPPEASVPGLMFLLSNDLPSGRYIASELVTQEIT
jgi:NAD(P)-dependent dehydrogenase (short-subunit alcohol dehydrogenase family)